MTCITISCLLAVLLSTSLAHTIHDNTTADGGMRFLVVGDWGGLPDFPYRTPIEMAVAEAMGKTAEDIGAQFVVALGDNFYFDGVKDIDDPRFRNTFEDVFTAPSLQKTTWYITAGNHDHNGNISAQIAYTQRSPRWYYPSLYYPFSLLTPDKTFVDIFMIDTVIMAGNSDDIDVGRAPAGPRNASLAEEQWSWLEDQMKNSNAEYMLVAGHYPVYSIAEHGPTPILVKRLDPLLHKYQATAYLCGHEHNIQHIQYTSQQSYNHTVDYFVSGAADFIEPSVDHIDSCVPPCVTKYHWANTLSLGSFSYIDVNKDRMLFTFVEANGKTLYETSMKPRKVTRR